MHLRGIIQSAILEENPSGSAIIEMLLRVQGVGPGQPRTLVVPYEMLLKDENLEPETVSGRAFEAEVDQAPDQRWKVTRISFASRIFRASE